MSLAKRLERLKLEDKIAKLARVHEHLLPGVIDMNMINKHVYEQGPSGEAGRVAREEGIDFTDVKSLRLEYLRILKIDYLWVLPNLTKLKLNNNSIEAIDNLHMLVHLRELDLSFNHIQLIENLEELVNLEILHLYQNDIQLLENLENQKQLSLLTLGHNQLEDRQCSILYLRQFTKLKSLNLEGNPMCATENFSEYVIAFLPNLVFFEYSMIPLDKRDEAKEIFRKEITLLELEEEKYRNEREAAHQEAAEVDLHSLAFVERLNGSQLFHSMFEDDLDGQVLIKISEETKEFYETFCEEMTSVCKELFRVGQEQYHIRKKEHDDFSQCVNETKIKSQEASQRVLEDFTEHQKNICEQISQIMQSLMNAEQDFENDRSEMLAEAALVIGNCESEFDELIHNTWRTLMQYELTLTEQMEEVNTTLERDMSDMVNVMLEQALGYFVAMRTLQEAFNEQITEAANRYLTMISLDSDDSVSISSQLREILTDKESLSNALANSHEKHLLVIDTREDTLITRIKAWHEEVCENLHKREVARSRAQVLEINRFLDSHRERFEELLSRRPRDLILLMEMQTQERSEGTSEDAVVDAETEVEISQRFDEGESFSLPRHQSQPSQHSSENHSRAYDM